MYLLPKNVSEYRQLVLFFRFVCICLTALALLLCSLAVLLSACLPACLPACLLACLPACMYAVFRGVGMVAYNLGVAGMLVAAVLWAGANAQVRYIPIASLFVSFSLFPSPALSLSPPPSPSPWSSISSCCCGCR